MELLKTLRASSPVFPNDSSVIKAVSMTDKIDVALKQLISNNILSAPVYNPNEKKYYCFFSMLDLIKEIVTTSSTQHWEQEGDINTVLLDLQDRKLFKKSIVADICDSSKRDPFIVVDSETMLDNVTTLMVKNNIRRVAVLNQKGELCNIITNSRIIECISHLFAMDKELEQLGKKTIKEMKIGTIDVISISSDKKAWDAFKLISKMGVSGVGVTDSRGKLIGSISDSDLKLIKPKFQYLQLLHLPVSEYLAALKKVTDNNYIYCKPSDSFKSVVENVAEKRAHRVFIVNDDHHPIGVVSLQDILEQIVIHHKK
ncbi:hypothetical protein ACTA71_001449 [Dictyostelium dimigraforme]